MLRREPAGGALTFGQKRPLHLRTWLLRSGLRSLRTWLLHSALLAAT